MIIHWALSCGTGGQPGGWLRARLAPWDMLRPTLIFADRSRALVLLRFSVACFWCRGFDDVFKLFLVRFGSLSGHLLGRAAHFVDHMFSSHFDYL